MGTYTPKLLNMLGTQKNGRSSSIRPCQKLAVVTHQRGCEIRLSNVSHSLIGIVVSSFKRPSLMKDPQHSFDSVIVHRERLIYLVVD
jgi:hypothetical protein